MAGDRSPCPPSSDAPAAGLTMNSNILVNRKPCYLPVTDLDGVPKSSRQAEFLRHWDFLVQTHLVPLSETLLEGGNKR